ncbi:MAG: hypothetical protein LQ351_006695 [Letrouitia transgressa]|nr:MAG: hypothetical protein LQ351_006695 [Letrouitia transgressa]
MRVFITGAAGFIGSATVEELIKHGHQVLGLTRSDASAEAIIKAGGEPHRGELKDLESLKRGAAASDGVVHLAFNHDFQDFGGSCATDRAAIEAMGEALAGSGKPLLIASGTLGLPKGEIGTEDSDHVRDNPPFSDRGLSSDLLYKLSKEKGIRGQVIRFPPTVHGVGDWGFVPILANIFREQGTALYIGDGSARWPATHRKDAAVLIRLALEKGAAGVTYHPIAEEGVKLKDIATVVGQRLQLPVTSVPPEQATEKLGFFATVMTDNPTSSEKTRKELGWQPIGPGLLEDLEKNYLF